MINYPSLLFGIFLTLANLVPLFLLFFTGVIFLPSPATLCPYLGRAIYPDSGLFKFLFTYDHGKLTWP